MYYLNNDGDKIEKYSHHGSSHKKKDNKKYMFYILGLLFLFVIFTLFNSNSSGNYIRQKFGFKIVE